MANTPKEDVLKIENGRLIVDVALTAGTMSQSGKNLVVFSTSGNVSVNGHKVGINVYRQP